MSLRRATIRLAATDPSLRPHLLPLLKRASTWFSGKGTRFADWDLEIISANPSRGGHAVSGRLHWHRGQPDGESITFSAHVARIRAHKRFLPWSDYRWFGQPPQGKHSSYLEQTVSFLTGLRSAKASIEALLMSAAVPLAEQIHRRSSGFARP